MRLQPKLISFTDELWKAIDICRGDEPRQAYMERLLRQSQSIKKAAKRHRIHFPPRPEVGRYDRKDQKKK